MKPRPITTLTAHRAETVRVRIQRNIKIAPNGCWVWTGYPDTHGYGRFRIFIDGVIRCTGAHRAAWLAYRGDIPADHLQLDHLCRNRLCCNPDHLELVTNQENARRSVAAIGAAGRGRPPGRANSVLRDTCKYGHPLSGENLSIYTPPTGYARRVCRACARRANLEWRERQRRAS